MVTALVLLIFFLPASSSAQPEKIEVSRDIQLIRISKHAYMHVSYADMPPFGKVGSNGLLFINQGKALLFDTPVTPSLTRTLVSWIRDSMGVTVTGFIPNHWHSDCMGGLAYIDSLGIESYANKMTIDIAEAKGLPIPRHGFTDSLNLLLGDAAIKCYYPGPAHSLDNIVVWIPSERILFAGCMVKELASETLGNTTDGDLSAYRGTIERVMKRYPDPRIVIPGHGAIGGKELLQHTRELASRKNH